MTRTDPLDRFAPWPQNAEDATADALIRHAVVHAYGALALVHAGHDAARQQVRVTQYVAIAQLLMDLRAADPAAAGAAALRLWRRLGDGADLEHAVARWVHRRSDPDEIARAAVQAYEARAGELIDASTLGPVVHIAAPHICIDGRYLRQLCAWCGHRLVDYDLDRVAVPVGQEGPLPTWPTGALVEVDGGLSILLGEWTADMRLPENTCHRRETAHLEREEKP